MARTPESHTLNFASNSNQVEDASQTQISNQYAAKGGSQTEITQEFAGDYISQTEISIQTAAEEVTGTDIRHMDASFYKAAAEGNMNILRNMSLVYMLDKLTPKRNTILHIASQFGQLHCVNWILQFRSLSSLLLQPNLKGDTPLHLAAREGHWVVTQVLIKAAKELPSGSGIGGDKMMLRMTNNENDTALHEAVRYNHSAVVKLLILEDPYFIYGANSSGGTPLYMAAERGFHELVQIIIDNTRNLPAHSGLTGRTALHAAVICNDEDMTKKILGWKNGLTKEVDDNGWSPLHCAAYLGYTSIARQLLEKSDKCVVYLRVKNDHKKTALHIAASCGHTEIVKLLVSQYPDCCEQVDDDGNNALHLIMIKRGIFHSSGLLNFPWMNFRGLMNEKNVEGKTPLHLLADYQMFNCRCFMKHKMVDKITPMDIMLSAEDLYGEKGPILERLGRAKASIGPLGWQKVIKQDNGGCRRKKEQVEDASQTQISNQYAAKGGSQTEITQEFAGDYISQTEISIQTAAEEVTGTDIRHMDASFYKAAAEGNMNILRNMSLGYMLDKLTPKLRNTTLHIAAQFGQLHCVNWILQFRSLSSLLLQPNLKGDTPLHLAAREGHWVVTQVLIKAAKELPSGRGIGGDKMMLRMTNNENDTALHEAVRYNHPAVVKLLILEDPYFIYGANSSGGTPLYMAAERGFHELVQIIIDNTRNLPAHSGLTGRTALHAAVICNDEDMTKKILGWKNGLTKEVDDNGWSPLHCAAYLGYTSIARQLLEKSDKCVVYLRVKNDHKKTALHFAASCGHTEIVKLLVSQYPDCCEQVDDNGNNALHLIMIKMGISGDSGLLNFPWMSFRGLMNEKNDEGKTPLHLLADHQMFHCRHFIMHKMVDKMVLDNNNSTPMDIMLSAEDKHGEKVPILERLRSAKARRGPLGWQKVIEEDIEGRRRKEAEKISEMKKTAKIHLMVAILVATLIYATGFQLPDVYDEKKGKDEGFIILAPPPNGHKDSMGWDKQRQRAFVAFAGADVVAFICSFIAVALYFVMFLGASNNVNIVRRLVNFGFILTYFGLLAMYSTFFWGLSAGFARNTFK